VQNNLQPPTWSSTEQVARPARNDYTRPTGELWGRAVDRGHGGATTRRPRRHRYNGCDESLCFFHFLWSSAPNLRTSDIIALLDVFNLLQILLCTNYVVVHVLFCFVLIFHIHRVAQKSANL